MSKADAVKKVGRLLKDMKIFGEESEASAKSGKISLKNAKVDNPGDPFSAPRAPNKPSVAKVEKQPDPSPTGIEIAPMEKAPKSASTEYDPKSPPKSDYVNTMKYGRREKDPFYSEYVAPENPTKIKPELDEAKKAEKADPDYRNHDRFNNRDRVPNETGEEYLERLRLETENAKIVNDGQLRAIDKKAAAREAGARSLAKGTGTAILGVGAGAAVNEAKEAYDKVDEEFKYLVGITDEDPNEPGYARLREAYEVERPEDSFVFPEDADTGRRSQARYEESDKPRLRVMNDGSQVLVYPDGRYRKLSDEEAERIYRTSALDQEVEPELDAKRLPDYQTLTNSRRSVNYGRDHDALIRKAKELKGIGKPKAAAVLEKRAAYIRYERNKQLDSEGGIVL